MCVCVCVIVDYHTFYWLTIVRRFYFKKQNRLFRKVGLSNYYVSFTWITASGKLEKKSFSDKFIRFAMDICRVLLRYQIPFLWPNTWNTDQPAYWTIYSLLHRYAVNLYTMMSSWQGKAFRIAGFVWIESIGDW